MRRFRCSHQSQPGKILLSESVPTWVRSDLRKMGYDMTYAERTSGPINAILFDQTHGPFWGGSSNHGEDYGIAW